MPPLTRLRVSTLRDLASQLRYAPRETILRQIDAAERLARDLDTRRNYPASWVVHRLTGYTPERADDDSLLVGEALAADLSALVERLSAQARLTLADLGPGAIPLPELCARWGVDRKTIERRRRQGLIARRALGPDGRARLYFQREIVERFEKAHAPGALGAERRRAGRPAGSRRLDAQTREVVLLRAARMRARLGWRLPRIADRLAARLRLSPHAVRTALERDGAFEIARKGRVTARDAGLAVRALSRGVPAQAVGARLGRTRASVLRIALGRRATFLRSLDLSCAVSPLFERPDAPDVLLAPAFVRTNLGAPGVADARAWSELARALPPPDESRELALAAAACFLRFRAARAIAALSPARPDPGDVDEAETLLRWASLALVELVRMHQRLALLSVEEHAGAALLDLSPQAMRAAHGAAFAGAADAALAFDPFRRPVARRGRARLAGAVGPAIARALAPLAARGLLAPAPTTTREGRPLAARRTPPAHVVVLDDWTRRVAPWQARLDPDPRARAGLDRLNALDADVLAHRFGWARRDGASGPPLTRADAARALRITVLRLVAIERRSLRIAVGLAPRAKVRRRA